MRVEEQNKERLAHEILAQDRLVQLARSEEHGPWLKLWHSRGRWVLFVVGFVIVALTLMDAAGPRREWATLIGLFCLLVGVDPFNRRADRRLDALVGALERNEVLSFRNHEEEEQST